MAKKKAKTKRRKPRIIGRDFDAWAVCRPDGSYGPFACSLKPWTCAGETARRVKFVPID